MKSFLSFRLDFVCHTAAVLTMNHFLMLYRPFIGFLSTEYAVAIYWLVIRKRNAAGRKAYTTRHVDTFNSLVVRGQQNESRRYGRFTKEKSYLPRICARNLSKEILQGKNNHILHNNLIYFDNKVDPKFSV